MVATAQTWITFKREFTLAHHDLRESQQTSAGAGYQGQANFTHETDDAALDSSEALAAITDLANSAATDRKTIATLTETNKKLCKDVHDLTTKLTDALERRVTANKKPTFVNKHYCWSCGTNCNHTSRNCLKKKEGHNDKATFADKKSGNENRFSSYN